MTQRGPATSRTRPALALLSTLCLLTTTIPVHAQFAEPIFDHSLCDGGFVHTSMPWNEGPSPSVSAPNDTVPEPWIGQSSSNEFECLTADVTTKYCEGGSASIVDGVATATAVPCSASAGLNENLAGRISYESVEAGRQKDKWRFKVAFDGDDMRTLKGSTDLPDNPGEQDTYSGRLATESIAATAISVVGEGGTHKVEAIHLTAYWWCKNSWSWCWDGAASDADEAEFVFNGAGV